MSDLLAIVGPQDRDRELLEEIARRRPDRVTVLVEDGDRDWASDESSKGRAIRDRIATLLHAIEQRTGAIVVGLAGSRSQLLGWRFDRVVGERPSFAGWAIRVAGLRSRTWRGAGALWRRRIVARRIVAQAHWQLRLRICR